MEATKIQHSVVDYLLSLNEEHSSQFIDSQRQRQAYRASHPTEIAVMKCMDGRVHFPVYTKTPLGVLQPWRNIGGKFDLGWPYFKETVQEWADYCVSKGRQSVVFTTYHFAKGFPGESEDVVTHRGCAGFGYDTAAAKAASVKLKEQFERVFRNDAMYVIQCGVETDNHALLLHGDNDEVWDLSEANQSTDPVEILSKLKEMYLNIPEAVLSDLIPLVRGNIQHVEELKQQERPKIEMEHRERVLAFGRGFDWLHEANLALIVSPYDINLAEPIIKAAGLLKKNIEEGRVSQEDGLVLLVSTPYRNSGFKQRLAEEKAKVLASFARSVLSEHVPEIEQYLSVVVATCNFQNRKLEVLEHIKSPHL